jgi:uncharacterized protein (TIGR00661 family)
LASIFYGMSGEGRGHATRARALVEALRGNHQITLFAADCAYRLLEPIYRGTDVRLLEIPGLRFCYSRPGRVDLLGTLAGAVRYRMSSARYVRSVLPEFERAKPDLVIADFEPILPRAARLCGVPFVSFDHQHYLVISDFKQLPFRLRYRAALSAPFVRALYNWQTDTIVSSFYRPPRRKAFATAKQVGVLVRPEMLSAVPDHGAHLVAYMRRFMTPDVLTSLAACGREVRVYGLGAHPSQGNLRFLPVDERRFMDDLATCAAVVSTAGNQLVGEALYLGKPLLVMPERVNFEQAINAHYLEQSGAGWTERGRLTPSRLGSFLDAVADLRAQINRDGLCGNHEAVAAISRHLGDAGPLPASRAQARTRPPQRFEWA